jgi:hypothetical protein
MKITDAMTTGASGFSPQELVGRTVVAVHDIEDSDRRETLLLLDNGRCCLLSCDPVVHDDEGVPLPLDKRGERWEVVLYDATDTEAGKHVR